MTTGSAKASASEPGLTPVTATTLEDQRGQAASAYFVVAYVAFALRVIGVGLNPPSE